MYQGVTTPVGGAISFTGDMNVVDYTATSKITIPRSECLRDTLYRIIVNMQAFFDNTPCNPSELLVYNCGNIMTVILKFNCLVNLEHTQTHTHTHQLCKQEE